MIQHKKSGILCKIRFYLRLNTITLSTWFVLLACIDRFISSSKNVTFRSWSSLRLAKRIIVLASIICFIFPYTQVFYCYSISQQNVCALSNSICKLTLDTTALICNSGIPPMLMVLISILTINNTKYFNPMNFRRRRRDVQLIRILVIQVIVLTLFAIPITTQKIYSCATIFKTKSLLQVAIENLINQICIETSYINNSTMFYVYALTSKKFRKEVFHILSSLFTCQFYKTNIVHPITVKYNSNPTEILLQTDDRCNRSKAKIGFQ